MQIIFSMFGFQSSFCFNSMCQATMPSSVRRAVAETTRREANRVSGAISHAAAPTTLMLLLPRLP